MKLVLVYLGDRLPGYAIDAIDSVVRTFPGRPVWFVGDDSRTLARAASRGVSTWLYQPRQSDMEFLRSAIAYDPKFRRGFWITTISRLWALTAFLKAHPHEAILHVETDVWLAPDFPFDRIERIPQGLAFPLINGEEGVASILFIRSAADAESLLQLAQEMVAGGHRITDMRLLGRAAMTPALSPAILPTSPSREYCVHGDLPEAARALVSSGVEEFGGVFDAATWGQYWLGLDPRNHGGRRPLFRDLPSHYLDCRQARLRVTETASLRISVAGQEWPLFNLHVHSKDRRAFRDMQGLIRSRISGEAAGVRQDWDIRVLASRIVGAPRNRLFRVLRAVSRHLVALRDARPA